MMTMMLPKKQRDELRRSELLEMRNSFLPRWQEIVTYIMPEDGEFFTPASVQGGRKDQLIFDNTPTLALRTFENGFSAAITSPAQRWFSTAVAGEVRNEYGPASYWSYEVQEGLYETLAGSNFYKLTPAFYRQYAGIGTAAMLMEEDVEDVVRFHVFPVGSYTISQNERGEVDCFGRDFTLTIRNVVRRYGEFGRDGELQNRERFSPAVLHAWDRQEGLEQVVQLFQIIAPNEEWVPNSLFAKDQQYRSCTYEIGVQGGAGKASAGDDRYLEETGYDYFPILVGRWQTVGRKPYGVNCPGMLSIGDAKQLQADTLKLSLAKDKLVDPPTLVDEDLRGRFSTLPGRHNFTSKTDPVVRPIYQVDPKLIEQEQLVKSCQARIQRAFYEDLFLMFSVSDRREFTATEVQERREEKLVGLGSPLQNLDRDFLRRLIENLFRIKLKRGLIPEAPEEIRGNPIQIKFVSSVAQAQRTVGLGSMDRFFSFASQVAAVDKAAALKLDTRQALDVYAKRSEIPPGIVRSDAEVAELDRQAQQAMAAERQAMMIDSLTKGAKTLSETDTEGKNALTDIAGALGRGGRAA